MDSNLAFSACMRVFLLIYNEKIMQNFKQSLEMIEKDFLVLFLTVDSIKNVVMWAVEFHTAVSCFTKRSFFRGNSQGELESYGIAG